MWFSSSVAGGVARMARLADSLGREMGKVGNQEGFHRASIKCRYARTMEPSSRLRAGNLCKPSPSFPILSKT